MVGEIIISGQIGSFPNEKGEYVKGVELRDVVSQVRALGEIDSLNVKVSTYGGIEKESDDIFKYLRSLPIQVDTEQVGPIASAGVKIFLAGKRRKYNPIYDFFIHNTRMPLPIGGSIDKVEAQKLWSVLTESTENLLGFYAAETGNTKEAFRPYMDKQTSLKGDEPLTFGFATEVVEDQLVINILQNKTDMSKFDELLKSIRAFAGVVAMVDIPLSDGATIVQVEAEPGEDLKGKPAKVNGQPAPVGEHATADGKILVVGPDGMVLEVKEAPAPVEVEDKKYKEMDAKIDKLAQAVQSLVQAQTTNNANVVKAFEEKIVALKSEIKTGHRPATKSVEAVRNEMSPADAYLKK